MAAPTNLQTRGSQPQSSKKISARYADAVSFRAIKVRIATLAGSGAHFQLSLDGPGNEGPLGGELAALFCFVLVVLCLGPEGPGRVPK